MEGDALMPTTTPPPPIESPQQQSSQSSPSRDPSKVSKSPLLAHEAIRLQDSESKLSPKNKSIATGRRISPSANTRILKKQDGTLYEGKLSRKPTWTKTAEIAVDGTPAGRDGRKFTVANVGMNGKMYLR